MNPRYLLLAAMILVVASAAAPVSGSIFDLKAGESKAVGPDGLTVGFDRVLSDSRCAIGLICIWEGDATVRLWARSNSHEKEEFDLHSHPFFQRKARFDGYVITLIKVDPYPVYGYPTTPESYSVTITVSGDLAPVEPTTWGRIKGLYGDT